MTVPRDHDALGTRFVCLFVCFFVFLFVCLFVCWLVGWLVAEETGLLGIDNVDGGFVPVFGFWDPLWVLRGQCFIFGALYPSKSGPIPVQYTNIS